MIRDWPDAYRTVCMYICREKEKTMRICDSKRLLPNNSLY